jgi:hypothetical protein
MLSCLYRAASRMFFITVATGFDIVKTLLGSRKRKLAIVLMGVSSFLFFAIEQSFYRFNYTVDDLGARHRIPLFSLIFTDTGICCWGLTVLIKTKSKLRAGQNLSILNVYRHFGNTIWFSIIASVLYMFCSSKLYYMFVCNWNDFWVSSFFSLCSSFQNN